MKKPPGIIAYFFLRLALLPAELMWRLHARWKEAIRQAREKHGDSEW